MRLVFIQKSTDRGGAKRSLGESLAAMRADGLLDPAALVGSPGEFTEVCAKIGVPTLVTPLPEWRKFFDRLKFSSAMKHAATLVADRRPDWIVSNEMWWGPHAARIARHLGCRSAVILRDGIATIPKAKQYRLFDNDLILPVSSTIEDALKPDPLFRDRVHVLFNSVSVPLATAQDRARLDNLLASYPVVRRWLLVVGKLSSRKNQADAVRITRSLIDAGHTDLGLLLAGDIDPAYLPMMEQVISSTGLGDRVAMIGHFDGVAALLERSHSLLLPSFREGLPRSLVEAITAGKPAFSYPCEGVEDIYADHLSDFVSEESTPDSLSRIIRDAWSHPQSAATVFHEVREGILSRFSPQAHLLHLSDLLDRHSR